MKCIEHYNNCEDHCVCPLVKSALCPTIWITQYGSDENKSDILIHFYDNGNYTAKIIGYPISTWMETGSTVEGVELKAWTFEVKDRDTADPNNGPNGNGCKNGAREEDEVEYDNAFTCNCAGTTYDGDNCEVATLPSGSIVVIKKSKGGNIVIAILGAMLLLAIVAVAVYKVQSHRQSMRAHDFQLELESMVESGELEPDQIGNGRAVPREIKRADVTMLSNIGSGAFGQVWKGMLDERSRQGAVPAYMVAIKTVIEDHGEAAAELQKEAALMALVVGHRNLVSLVGVVTSGRPLLVLISYCENGSLRSYLKAQREIEQMPISPGNKLRMCADIARGMEHLSVSLLVHRDLAARNVLVDSGLVCKVADFGLARFGSANTSSENGLYYRSTQGVFSVRWTAPEAMETNIFTTRSDVWAFGITMYEVYKDGGSPYDGMRNPEVILQVRSGYRLPSPHDCRPEVFAIMKSCWNVDPAARPTFEVISSVLASYTADDEAAQADVHDHAGMIRHASSVDKSAYNTPDPMNMMAGNPIPEPAAPPTKPAKDNCKADGDGDFWPDGNVNRPDVADNEYHSIDKSGYVRGLVEGSSIGVGGGAATTTPVVHELNNVSGYMRGLAPVAAQPASGGPSGYMRGLAPVAAQPASGGPSGYMRGLASLSAEANEEAYSGGEADEYEPTLVEPTNGDVDHEGYTNMRQVSAEIAMAMAAPAPVINSESAPDVDGYVNLPRAPMAPSHPSGNDTIGEDSIMFGIEGSSALTASSGGGGFSTGFAPAEYLDIDGADDYDGYRPEDAAAAAAAAAGSGPPISTNVAAAAAAAGMQAAGSSGRRGSGSGTRNGPRSAASVKRVRSRANTLSTMTVLEGSFTVIFAGGKKGGNKMFVLGTSSDDAQSNKLEVYDKTSTGTKGMPKLTIRGKNIIAAVMSTVKKKDCVVVTDAQNRNQAAARTTTFLAADSNLLAELLIFASRSVAIGEGALNDESAL